MDSTPPCIERRQFLRRTALASALGAGGLGSLLLGANTAHAADYKALVCVFLYGGNDGLNTVVPTDSRYTAYSTVRGALALPQNRLVALQGSSYGLHPALAPLAPIWNTDRRLATVFNVGPLRQPLTKEAYGAAGSGSSLIPDSLFSHSDQQLLWQSGLTEVQQRTGWGARAADAWGGNVPVVSVGGNAYFGLSSQRSALVLPGPGSYFGAFGLDRTARKAALDTLYGLDGQSDLLRLGYAQQTQDAFAKSASLMGVVGRTPGGSSFANDQAIDAAFSWLMPDGYFVNLIGAQLYQVAKLIAANATLGGNRQIFFAEQDGYDTHSDQITAGNVLAGRHATLLTDLGVALAAFYNAMKAIGRADSVTLFTQSDFGRTFRPNNSLGTDHAWGNTQLVMGGAVIGGTYGTHPTLQLGGPNDVGATAADSQGRWIPTTSVNQYAATLLNWFGASPGQLDQVLPHLGNFGGVGWPRTLGFV